MIVEAPVSLTVNGEIWLTFLCTPVDLDALAIGFLFNEGVIDSMAEVASVHVCPSGENVDVWLRRDVARPKQWARTSGCTGGITSIDSLATLAPMTDGVRLTPDAVTHLIGQLFAAQQLYREAGGVHSSALSDGRRIRLAAEDIGRHNTLDKIAGRCLLDRIVISESVLLTTGRISSEMLRKAARMGAPIVISRTSPTSLSIELAEQLGITLIGYARRDGFSVYTYPERIACSSYRRFVFPSAIDVRLSSCAYSRDGQSQPAGG